MRGRSGLPKIGQMPGAQDHFEQAVMRIGCTVVEALAGLGGDEHCGDLPASLVTQAATRSGAVFIAFIESDDDQTVLPKRWRSLQFGDHGANPGVGCLWRAIVTRIAEIGHDE